MVKLVVDTFYVLVSVNDVNKVKIELKQINNNVLFHKIYESFLNKSNNNFRQSFNPFFCVKL